MVLAWYIDEETCKDRYSARHRDPPQYVPLEDLYVKTRIKCVCLPVDAIESEVFLAKLRAEHGYAYVDEVAVCLQTFTQPQIDRFYAEHLHPEQEIRYVLDGSGYFDVRDEAGSRIRLAVAPGDLIIMPPRTRHRFTLDSKVTWCNREKTQRRDMFSLWYAALTVTYIWEKITGTKEEEHYHPVILKEKEPAPEPVIEPRGASFEDIGPDSPTMEIDTNAE